MEFMHEYGIYCYNPTDKAVLLMNTVSVKNQGFYKRKINGVEQPKTLYAKLGYPSVKDFRVDFSNPKIVDCPVTVQDIDIA